MDSIFIVVTTFQNITLLTTCYLPLLPHPTPRSLNKFYINAYYVICNSISNKKKENVRSQSEKMKS